MSQAPEGREIHITFQPEWAPAADDPGRGGLFATDGRVRTLLKVLVSYPDTRHAVPDRLSLEATADPRLLETITRFLERQAWLVRSVAVH